MKICFVSVCFRYRYIVSTLFTSQGRHFLAPQVPVSTNIPSGLELSNHICFKHFKILYDPFSLINNQSTKSEILKLPSILMFKPNNTLSHRLYDVYVYSVYHISSLCKPLV